MPNVIIGGLDVDFPEMYKIRIDSFFKTFIQPAFVFYENLKEHREIRDGPITDPFLVVNLRWDELGPNFLAWGRDGLFSFTTNPRGLQYPWGDHYFVIRRKLRPEESGVDLNPGNLVTIQNLKYVYLTVDSGKNMIIPSAYNDPASVFKIERLNDSNQPHIQRGDRIKFTSEYTGLDLGAYLNPRRRGYRIAYLLKQFNLI